MLKASAYIGFIGLSRAGFMGLLVFGLIGFILGRLHGDDMNRSDQFAFRIT